MIDQLIKEEIIIIQKELYCYLISKYMFFSPGRTLQEPLCICLLLCSPFSEQSTQPLPRPAWRQLLISCTVQTAYQVHYKCTVYRGWNKQPYNCSKQSVCSPVPRMCMRVPNSCSICRACLNPTNPMPNICSPILLLYNLLVPARPQ